MKRLFLVLLFLWATLLFPLPTSAGGGRMTLYSASTAFWHVREGIINAQVYVEGSGHIPSVNEQVEFRIKNPQPGDHCITEQPLTSDLGLTYGTCYANSEREMQVYLVSLDKGDESSVFLLHFAEPPTPIPTRVVTTAPTPSPTTLVATPTVSVVTPTPSLTQPPVFILSSDVEIQNKSNQEQLEATSSSKPNERGGLFGILSRLIRWIFPLVI